MRIFVINLDRRDDRMTLMDRQLAALGLAYERVAAMGAEGFNEVSGRGHLFPGANRLTRAELACLASHKHCWQRIAQSGSPCLVLEDDVVLSPRIKAVIAAPSQELAQADIIKLETRIEPARIDRDARSRPGGIGLHRLRGMHLGAAGYIISPMAAARLVSLADRVLAPTDHLLFDPVTPGFDALAIYQAVPALCIQGDIYPPRMSEAVFGSDIETDRRDRFTEEKVVLNRPQKLVREMRRLVRQTGYAGRRIADMITGRKTMRIPFDEGEDRHAAAAAHPLH